MTIAPQRRPVRAGRLIACALAAWLLGLGLAALPCTAASALPPKTLRLAVDTDGDGFDPATYQATVSNLVAVHVFDPLYRFALLRRGYVPVPNAAVAAPRVSADGLVWTIEIRPGIFFADDPAFGGRRRELTAADYVFSIRRLADPRSISLGWQQIAGRIAGLDALRAEAERTRRFDHDRPIDGLQALDRYRLRIVLTKPMPNLANLLATCQVACAVAREVVEHYGDRVREHPVGTGPFRLARWLRGSRVVLERNPAYRDQRYDEAADPGDTQAEAVAARLAGRRLPMLDRVELEVVNEAQPRWLAFLRGEHDLLRPVPPDFLHLAVARDRPAPHLAARGVQLHSARADGIRYTFFNMEHPVVGGYSAPQVALRRAIALGYDLGAEIAVLRRGHAVPQQTLVAPTANGFDPDFVSPLGESDPVRARALLDVFGFVDRDGDGYREFPDGRPLALEFTSPPGGTARESDELWRRSMDAIGIRIEFRKLIFAELIRAVNSGTAMMASFGWIGASGDALDYAQILFGPNAGASNDSRFRLPAYDRLYEQAAIVPDGAERNRLLREMDRIAAAYAPLRLQASALVHDLAQPRVVGYLRRPAGLRFDRLDLER
jgi:ABC-type transport system substrate-binding protein